MSDESNETTTDEPSAKGPYHQAPDDEATEAAEVESESVDTEAEADASDGDDAAADEPTAAGGDKAEADDKAARKAKADAAIAARTVTRRTVTSRRVTPKGGVAPEVTSTSKARDAKKTEAVVTRTPPPTVKQQAYAKGPSPWYVPALMFGLLIIGALVIMTNYMGVFGDASNVRLVLGLGFILGGIVAATQYR